MNEENIFIVSKEKDINLEVSKLFVYYRDSGFPNYDLNSYNSDKELDKIIKFNEKSIVDGKDLGQTMHGLGFLWTFSHIGLI